MNILERHSIPPMEATNIRVVYGSDQVIPQEPIRYVERPLNGQPVSDEARSFHEKLVALGELPVALQQRYGVDPFLTYCDPKTHPAEYIKKANVTYLREAMERAVDVLLADAQLSESESDTEANAA